MEDNRPRNQQQGRVRRRARPQGVRPRRVRPRRVRPRRVRPRRVRAPAAAANEGIDLDITLNKSRAEQAADSMYRLNIEPTDAIGSQFEPFNVPERPFKVHNLPASPLELFQHFLPVWLVECWVSYTNNNLDTIDPRDPGLSDYSRVKA
jgi:hypothetical protein